MLAALFFFSTVLAALLYYVKKLFEGRSSSGKLPPGPPGWPILGNIDLVTGPNQHERLRKIGDKYGGMFTMTVGVRKTVWLTKYKLIRDAVVNHSWEFAGRPQEAPMFHKVHKGIVASGVSEEEKEVRRFTLVTLRNFGFGKTSMQDALLHEALDLVEVFKRKIGRPFPPRNDLANAAGNIISSMLLGTKFEQGDEGFKAVAEDLTEAVKLFSKVAMEVAFPAAKWLSNTNRNMRYHCDRAETFMQKIIEAHVATHVPGEPRDFIDTWLDEEAKSNNGHAKRTFLREKMSTVLLDIFTGGFETTATSFLWLFAVILTYPEVQELIHAELDVVVGRGSSVTLEHRDVLPYTEAVILETQRMFPLVAFALPHMATKETIMGGFVIPTGTPVTLHLYSVLHDPELWDQPNEFRPERFIKDGKLIIPDFFLAFSAGRRSCIGEQLARKELFIYFANIMQNLSIVLPAGAEKPSLEKQVGVVMYPLPFEIEVKLR